MTAAARRTDTSRRLGFRETSAANAFAIRRLKTWTRQRLSLSEDCTITVAELACKQRGCPPLETVVAFWSEDGRRHRFKILKPVADVDEDDLPPGWLKNSLVDYGDIDTYCC